jgi:hypothetical protein
MPVITFPLAGPTILNPSQSVNTQRKTNVFTATAGYVGRGDPKISSAYMLPSVNVLLPSAGLQLLAATGGNVVRAIIILDNGLDLQGVIYVVVDLTVYLMTINTITLATTLTSIGTLDGNPTAPISWDYNPTQIVMVDGEKNWGWVITYSTNTLTKITSPNFVGGDTVVFMDTYFIYNQPGTQKMWASQINDGIDYNALDVASAESRADTVVGLVVDKEELIVLGTNSIEVWYDAANPTGFPFSIRPGEYYDVGCCAKNSIRNIDNVVFFVDHHRYLCSIDQTNGLTVLINPDIRNEWAKYSYVGDAFAFVFEDSGQLMYQITFPTANKTWVYDLITQDIHERGYWDGSGAYSRHRANVAAKYQNVYICGDYANGNIYAYSNNYFTDNGTSIRRLISTAFLHNEDLLTTINSLYLHGEFGRGLTTGQGNDPQVMLRWSNDGGFNWSNEIWESLGKGGEYIHRVKWYRLGTERQWKFEFVISDPIKFSLAELGIDIEVNNV